MIYSNSIIKIKVLDNFFMWFDKTITIFLLDIGLVKLAHVWAGLSFIPAWVHCNGESSHTSIMLCGYHHPKSITWRWALYWSKSKKFSGPHIFWRSNGQFYFGSIPFIGSLNLSWQQHMFTGGDK